MLSVEECQKYLRDENLSDKEVEEIRNLLYNFIEMVLDNYINSSIT